MKLLRTLAVVALLTLVPAHSFAALTANTSSTAKTNSGVLSWSHNNGTADLLVVFYSEGNAPVSSRAVTYAGVSMTNAVYKKNTSESNSSCSVYYLTHPAAGANSVSIESGNGYVAGAISFTGADMSNPVDTTSTAQANSTSPSLTLNTRPSSFAVDVVGMYTGLGDSAPTKGANQSVIYNDRTANSIVRGFSSLETASSTHVMSWTLSPDAKLWAQCGMGIKEAAARSRLIGAGIVR